MSEFAAAEHLRPLPDPAAGYRQDLPAVGNGELLALAASLPRSSEQRAAALDLLVTRYRQLVWSCVQRYSRSSEPVEDLMQVGYVGLLKAINNFDPALGFSLATSTPNPWHHSSGGSSRSTSATKSGKYMSERPLQERVLEDPRQAEHLLTQQLRPHANGLRSRQRPGNRRCRHTRGPEGGNWYSSQCLWTGLQTGRAEKRGQPG